MPEKPGLHEILDNFAGKGIKMAVASSSDREQVENNLALTGIRHYFQAVVNGAEVEKGKPNPDIFLLAADRLGLPPESCYVFEDSLSGIRAGHAAGCLPVMIPDLVQPPEEIRSLCFAVYPDLGTAAACLTPERD